MNNAIGVMLRYDMNADVTEHWSQPGDSLRTFSTVTARGWLYSWEDFDVASANCTGEKDPDDGEFCTGGIRDTLAQTFVYYDDVGNRTDRSATIGNGNRLTAFDGDTLQYDNAGNLTRKWRTDGSFDQRFYWNPLGQLDSVWTKNQGTMRFGYDGFGRRVRVDDAGTEKRFIYDGAHVFMELDVSGSISIVAEYTYYPGMDRPHSVRRGGATGSTYYYAVDYPGNVVGLIDGNDDLAARYRYAPFGESELATGSLAQANPLRFAAREYDATSGLYYMRARYYDPEVGRFISEDPLGLEAGINPYLYVENNPMRGRDPTGLSPSYGTEELVGTIWDAFSRYELTRWTIVFGGWKAGNRGWTTPWRTTYMPTNIFDNPGRMGYLVYHEGYHVKQRDDWGFLAYSGRGMWNIMKDQLSRRGWARSPYDEWGSPVRRFSDLPMEAQAEVWGLCWGMHNQEACDVLKKLGEDIPEEMEN